MLGQEAIVLKKKKGNFRLGQEDIFYSEDGEALEEVAQNVDAPPHPPQMFSRGPSQPDVVGGSPAFGRELELDDL